MKPSWQEMSKDELIEELRAGASARLVGPDQAEALLHDMHVQKAELEMRNLELRDSRRLLEESRARYAELYDFAPIALCTLDPEGRIIDANLTLTALVGSGDRTRLDRRALGSMVLPEDRALFRSHLRRCLAERSRSTCEVRLRVAEMGVVHFQAVSTALINEAGVAVACKTVLTDVSALKRSEERMRLIAAASASLASSFDVVHTLGVVARSLVPAAADICFVDLFERDEEPKRIAVAVGDAARRVVGEAIARGPIPRVRRREPVLVSRGGTDLIEAMLAETPERAAIVESLDVGSVVMAPLLARDHQLGTLTLLLCGRGRSFTEADLAFGTDIASRAAMAIDNARLYQGAQAAIQVRQEVLSVVSHDLKTPLTGILLSADTLIAHAPAGERRKGRKAIERIKRTARQMEHIIDDLLDMVCLETGHLSLDQSTQCIRQLIDEAIEQLNPLANEKEVVIAAETLTEASWVRCDPHRVIQVLINLIGNAIKFAPRGGSVKVSVDNFEDKVRISIRDNGPGITSAVLRNLFQRYWQAKETANRGRGLGLFISKGIIEAQGGTIWVESKPSEGANFHFTIPSAPRPQPNGKAGSLMNGSDDSTIVMVVEDDDTMRELMRDTLARQGWGVAEAANGSEALDYLKSGGVRPSLMLVDLDMPVMNGRDLVRSLRADVRYSDIPVVLVSCADRVTDEASALGAAAGLRKPLDVSALLAVVGSKMPAAQA